ncbi:MAG TPA: NAD(P)/FAD-dependent oxidoreductase [Thermomonospora sp.]|nr:NAD(P)/FAD-dependent oxidoreductase [Thermomonospora sp.]
MAEPPAGRPDHEVVVVGAGFSGLCMGVRLRQAGIGDFAILDAASGVGGVWRHNTYPGVAVDVPSVTYSYSFEPNPSWSRAFAPGEEVRRYAEHCADRYRLRPHLRLNTRVERAEFDEERNLWRVAVRTADGPAELTARFLVSAVGPLDQPKNPDIAGLDSFTGTIIHTARWDHGHDLRGERVAVIGTGASGLQVIPEIAAVARRLDVYQRTPIWVFPKIDFAIPRPVRSLFRVAPPAQRLVRAVTALVTEAIMVLGIIHYRRLPFLVRAVEAICRAHLRRQVPDPDLRRRLTPRYGFGCKRPSFSNRYFPTFLRDNVELVTTPIARVTPTGIVTADGRERAIDTLVLATGFRILEPGAMPAFPVVGLDGVELGAFWDEHRYQNYEGLSVPQAPNFWLMNGPYTVTGASWFAIIEAGCAHIVRCLAEARRRNAVRMAVRQEPHDAYTAEVRRLMCGTILFQPSCARSNSYYFDRHGDAPYVRPHSGARAWWRARTFDLDDYAYTTRGNP